MNPDTNRFEPFPPELMEKFNNPLATLTPEEEKKRTWTRFAEGETVEVKGVKFSIHEIGESRLVLKPLDKPNWTR
jgi:hypothetical protein